MAADRRVEHLLIGGGIACATAARTLREAGADGRSCSSAASSTRRTTGRRSPRATSRAARRARRALIHPADWWADHDVELLTRTSVHGDRPGGPDGQALQQGDRRVRDRPDRHRRDGPQRLGVDGTDLDGIHYLRALANADAIRRDTAEAEQIVLIGGSYIGCEVAASLTVLGKRCVILMQEAHPARAPLRRRAGRFFRSRSRRTGSRSSARTRSPASRATTASSAS